MAAPFHTPHPSHVVCHLFYYVTLCCYVLAAHQYGTRKHFVDFDHMASTYRYVLEGDLNIGAILPIHRHGQQGACGRGLRDQGVVQYVEALTYAVRQINQDRSLLENYDLGMVVLDDCDTPETALGQALHFMPLYSHSSRPCHEDCSSAVGADGDQRDYTFYDVVGVIGSEGSDSCMMVANLLGLFDVPQISPWATSDLLSDKSVYPYFMRMIPPDRFQVEAIMQLIVHFNWTYISIVYSKGGYGEGAFGRFSSLLEQERSICVGKVLQVSPDDTADVYRKAIQSMYESKVLVVVLLTDQEESHDLLDAAKRLQLVGHFVWVGSDGLGINIDDFDGLEEVVLGSLSLRAYSVTVPGFQTYFEALRPGNTDNPWFNESWAALFGCHWNHGNGGELADGCPLDHRLTASPSYRRESYVSTIIDTVYVFAAALDKLIRKHCPGVSKDKVRQCVSGFELLGYLRNSTLPGYNGIITFDDSGDMLGKYEIRNFQRHGHGRYVNQQVGVWDASTHTLHLDDSDVVWHVNRTQQVVRRSGSRAPTSQCGEACADGYIYSYFRDTCCWECRPCNANEITVANATKCALCAPYTWPNSNASHCVQLQPYYVRWSDALAVVFVIVAVAGVSACAVFFAVFLTHHNNRLIKATSRELSYIMLGGVTMQYVLLVSIVSKPTAFVCYFNYIGFNVSFSVVYAPLLTRTNRIYRIFHSGRRTKIVPSFTSPVSQIIIALSLVAIQVTITTLANTIIGCNHSNGNWHL